MRLPGLLAGGTLPDCRFLATGIGVIHRCFKIVLTVI